MGTEMTAVQPAEENILQRNYKDSAFLMVFGEPEKMVELYNGTDPLPPVSRLELSDCFLGEGKSLLNLSVAVYNINEGAGCKLTK